MNSTRWKGDKITFSWCKWFIIQRAPSRAPGITVRDNLFLGGTRHYLSTWTFWWLKKLTVYAKAALGYCLLQPKWRWIRRQPNCGSEEKLVFLHVPLIFITKGIPLGRWYYMVGTSIEHKDLLIRSFSMQKT